MVFIHARGMLSRDEPQASVFSFLKDEQHLKCMDERYSSRKTIWQLFYKITAVKQRKTFLNLMIK